MKNIINVLLVLSLLAGCVVTVGMAGQRNLEEYRIIEIELQSGDTLWKIASVVNDGSYNNHKVINHIEKVNGAGPLIRYGNVVKVPNISNKSESELVESGLVVVKMEVK